MAVHNNFSSAFKSLNRKVVKTKNDLPSVIANEGTNFFVSSFDKQGFEDTSLEKWKPRKKNKNLKEAGRKILTKSGRLKRAVNNSVKEKNSKRVVWSVDDVPYAQIHNEGGVIHKKASTQIAEFKFGKTKSFSKSTSQGKKISQAEKALKKNEDTVSNEHKLLKSYKEYSDSTKKKIENLKGLKGAAKYRKSVKGRQKVVKTKIKSASAFIKGKSKLIRSQKKALAGLKSGAKKELSVKKGKAGKRLVRVTSGSKKAVASRKIDISAHSIKMPKRQYMGESVVLRKKLRSKITGAFKKTFS